MTRRQARRMIRHESVITALIGAAIGIPLGVGLAAIITARLSDQGFGFSVPVGSDRGLRHRCRHRRHPGGSLPGAARRAAERAARSAVRVVISTRQPDQCAWRGRPGAPSHHACTAMTGPRGRADSYCGYFATRRSIDRDACVAGASRISARPSATIHPELRPVRLEMIDDYRDGIECAAIFSSRFRRRERLGFSSTAEYSASHFERKTDGDDVGVAARGRLSPSLPTGVNAQTNAAPLSRRSSISWLPAWLLERDGSVFQRDVATHRGDVTSPMRIEAHAGAPRRRSLRDQLDRHDGEVGLGTSEPYNEKVGCATRGREQGRLDIADVTVGRFD